MSYIRSFVDAIAWLKEGEDKASKHTFLFLFVDFIAIIFNTLLNPSVVGLLIYITIVYIIAPIIIHSMLNWIYIVEAFYIVAVSVYWLCLLGSQTLTVVTVIKDKETGETVTREFKLRGWDNSF